VIDFRLRRTRWLATAAVGMLVVVAAIAWNSRACAVIVYNESEDPREGVFVRAPGFAWSVPPLAGRESRRRGIPLEVPAGSFEVHLGRAGEPGVEVWFEPRAGRRLSIRVWRDGLVETDVQPAWWE
jgi:hypothetical protein